MNVTGTVCSVYAGSALAASSVRQDLNLLRYMPAESELSPEQHTFGHNWRVDCAVAGLDTGSSLCAGVTSLKFSDWQFPFVRSVLILSVSGLLYPSRVRFGYAAVSSPFYAFAPERVLPRRTTQPTLTRKSKHSSFTVNLYPMNGTELQSLEESRRMEYSHQKILPFLMVKSLHTCIHRKYKLWSLSSDRCPAKDIPFC